MRFRIAHFLTAAAFGLAIGFASAGPADAQSVMKVCGAQWKAAKAAGATNGETWPQFLAQCRTQQNGASAAPSAQPQYAPAPAAPVVGKTASECSQEYAANKAAIKASGQSKRAYVAACRAGTTAAPTSAPNYAPAPQAAPAQTAYPAPTQPAYPAPAPVPQVGSASPIACPGDTAVWVNTKSHIYHFPGTRNYGRTKQGTYMCERAAQAAGDRAAENEHHP
jgi:hypothetical protein